MAERSKPLDPVEGTWAEKIRRARAIARECGRLLAKDRKRKGRERRKRRKARAKAMAQAKTVRPA